VFELDEQVYAVLTQYDSSFKEFYGWEVNPQLSPLAFEPEILEQLLRYLSDVRRKGSAGTRQDSSMIVGFSETCPDGSGMEDCATIPVSDDAVVVPAATFQLQPSQSVKPRTHVWSRPRRGRGSRMSASGKSLPVELAYPSTDSPGIPIPVELDLPVSAKF
jgi:hypothetical protein